MPTAKITAPNVARNSDSVLRELAERAAKHYGRSLDFDRRSAEAWFQASAVLVEARAVAKRGQWIAFLEHSGIPRRTATRMVRIGRVGVEMGHVAHLRVRRVDGLICQLRRVFDSAIGDCRERYEAWLDQGRSDHDWRQWNLTPDEVEDEFQSTARALVALLAGRPDGAEIADRIIDGGSADV